MKKKSNSRSATIDSDGLVVPKEQFEKSLLKLRDYYESLYYGYRMSKAELMQHPDILKDLEMQIDLVVDILKGFERCLQDENIFSKGSSEVH